MIPRHGPLSLYARLKGLSFAKLISNLFPVVRPLDKYQGPKIFMVKAPDLCVKATFGVGERELSYTSIPLIHPT